MELSKEKKKTFLVLLEKAKQYGLDEDEPNLFDTAVRKHYENPTTELLSYFLSPNNKHGLENAFFEGFIYGLHEESHENEFTFEHENFVNIETEVQTQSGNRIDLLVESSNYYFVIEVKKYHQQNNPFKDYEKFANSLAKLKNKTAIYFVLSIQGESEAVGWDAISYDDLSWYIKQGLASCAINNPFNKWVLFAREFLLHLESYNKTREINMDRVNFILNNVENINELMEQRNSAYEEIKNHINSKLQEELGMELATPELTGKDNNPYFRFVININDFRDDVNLTLNTTKTPVQYELTAFIGKPTDELVKAFTNSIQRRKSVPNFQDDKRTDKGLFHKFHWSLGKFEIDEALGYIVEIAKSLVFIEQKRVANK